MDTIANLDGTNEIEDESFLLGIDR